MKWCDGKAKRSATWDTSSSRTRIHRSWRMTRLPSRAGRCPGSRGDVFHPHNSIDTFLVLRSTPLPHSSSSAPPHHLTIRQHEPLLLTQTYGGGHPPAPKMESGGDDCARSLHRRYPRIECTAAPRTNSRPGFRRYPCTVRPPSSRRSACTASIGESGPRWSFLQRWSSWPA